MADDHNVSRPYDGRFGDRFDDEIDLRGVVQVTVGVAVTCVVAMLLTWGMVVFFGHRAALESPPPSPVEEANLRRLPTAPLLQAKPEHELAEMRREMAHHLASFGWADEASGTVHIPIEQAMELLVARGPLAAGAAPSSDAIDHSLQEDAPQQEGGTVPAQSEPAAIAAGGAP